ncbi:MAG: hypothetical protein WCB14_16540 [Candidatus Acidiferrales bacterium]
MHVAACYLAFTMTPNSNTQLDRPGVPTPVDPERHARKCAICRSQDRQEIENAFLHWISPDFIADEFDDVPDRMTLYRHVHATGLYEFRRRNLRCALDRLIESAGSANVSGDCVIRAIRAYSRLNDDGHWIDPVQRVVISRQKVNFAASEEQSDEVLRKTILIETPKRLETAATPTKESTDLVSNRDKIDPSPGLS